MFIFVDIIIGQYNSANFLGNKYGIISIDNLYGLIDKNNTIIIDAIYDNIDTTESYIITLKNQQLDILDSNINNLTSENHLSNIKEFIAKEEDNYLYIYATLTDGTSKPYKFDTNFKTYIQ